MAKGTINIVLFEREPEKTCTTVPDRDIKPGIDRGIVAAEKTSPDLKATCQKLY